MDDEDTFGTEHGRVFAWLRERRGDCPDAERLVALAEGDVTPEERALLQAHVGLCAGCARDVESIAAGPADVDERTWECAARRMDDRPTPWRPAGAGVPRSRRIAWMGMGAAAGLFLAVGLVWRSLPESRMTPAGSTTRGVGIQVVEPAGSVPRVERFEWSAPPVRATFRIEVRRGSELIWQGLAEHSPFVAPQELCSLLQPRVRHSWRVVATGADQKTFLESEWTPFQLVP